MATADDNAVAWSGPEGQVSQLRGLVFKFGCLGATLLALGLVFVFLLYVANDAFRPLTADPGWLLTVLTTVFLPAIALSGYYFRYDTRAGEVAYISLGLPIATTLLACGFVIVFRHVVTPQEWLALTVSAAVMFGAFALHARYRDPGALERFGVVTVVPILTVLGIPSVVPSLRTLLLSLPVLPTAALSLVIAFTLPVAALVGRYVRRVRESDRTGLIAGAATLVVAALGLGIAPVVGISPMAWIVLVTIGLVPVGLYVEAVLRNGDGVSGLAFPLVIVAGTIAAFVLVDALGFAGPNHWVDWQFLTSAHSRTAEDAGIYPALVGSVMMLIVIVVAAFPVGVGAAIYLEEYAPNEGRLGSLVDLIQLNIANLAGVPSVVYGILGLALFVRTIGMQPGIVVVGGFTVGLLILPIVIVSAQEAIRGVPDSLRQASYGMGATRWQTVRNVVLPRAMPGILTGTILALGRAIGETAPLLIIGSAASVRIAPDSFSSLFSAMPRQIYAWVREAKPLFQDHVSAAGIVVLLVVLLMMNASAIVLRNKYQRSD